MSFAQIANMLKRCTMSYGSSGEGPFLRACVGQRKKEESRQFVDCKLRYKQCLVVLTIRMENMPALPCEKLKRKSNSTSTAGEKNRETKRSGMREEKVRSMTQAVAEASWGMEKRCENIRRKQPGFSQSE